MLTDNAKELSLEEMDALVTGMSPKERNHFKHMVSVLATSFGDKDAQIIVVHGNNKTSVMEIMAINANDESALELLDSAAEYMEFVSERDTPPREKFN